MAMERADFDGTEEDLMEDMDKAIDMDAEFDDSPEIIELEDGGVDVILIAELDDVDAMEFDANLAEGLDDDLLAELSTDLLDMIQQDIDSRSDWADTFVKGMEVLGFDYEERTEPWDGACGVYSTVLAEAAIRFQAETMSETFPAAGPVRVKILGEETKEKVEASERVKADMNYELTENMVEYRPEHERMLYSLGLAGSAFKKIYYDPNIGRQAAVYIPAEEVIVPYGATHIQTAERVTHIMRKTKNELRKLQANGFYRDVELDDPEPYLTDIQERKAKESGYTMNDDDRYALYEVHAELVIEGINDCGEDEIAKPYIVTLERSSGEVMSIRRNWEEDDELALKRQHFVHYVYVPGFGFYGLGLIHIIGGYAKAGTSIIRQLVDAGTLSNLPGGLKTRGLRIKGDNSPVMPGEFKDVDVPSGSIRDNIMALPYKEPSQTLLQLLDKITNEGRRLGAISDMNISDMSANAPVGTTLALLERTLKPMAAVQARVHYAMKQEFKLLKKILAEYADDDYAYQPLRGEISARKSDYTMVEVIPVSDPNSSTMAQRVVQYQAVHQLSQSAPQIYDLPQLHRQMIEVLGVKNADKLVPIEEDMVPADPVSENMNALIGKPMKAFLYQDQDAHIGTHMAFMQDPTVTQMIGQNPQANQIMASLQAHIAEHLGFKYRKDIEEKLGVTLPPPNEPLPEDIEVQLSQLIVDAGKQLTQANQQAAAQKKAQEQQKDPLIQMQQQELQLKQAEQQRKAAKDQLDGQIKQQELQIKQAEQQRKSKKDMDDMRATLEELKLKKVELGVEVKSQTAKTNLSQQDNDRKRGLDILKTLQPAGKGPR